MSDSGRPDSGPVAAYDDPRAFLVAARERVTGFQRGTDSAGSRITRLYTAAVDNTLRAAHRRALEDGNVGAQWGNEDFCLVATGGYARKALCPYSDVDVMLITAQPDEERLEEHGRRLLYPLWDAGLQVGHHPGTVEEILARAEHDLCTQTALLDLRYVAGSRSLYQHVLDRTEEGVEAHKEALLKRVRTENLMRFQKYGQSVFLLEPHVKEGKGGLRDFHWLCWITKLLYGLRGDYDFLLGGVVEPDHYRDLVEAYEFLLRVRVQLHVQHGRAQDRLHFDSQEPVARAMGFAGRKGLLAVERFMGEYYRHAYTLAHTVGLYVARMLDYYWDEVRDEDREGEPLLVGPSAPVVRADWTEEKTTADGLFLLKRGSVRCTDPERLAREPQSVFSLFEVQQSFGGRLHHDTLEYVRSSLSKVSRRFREDPESGSRFRALLEGPGVFRILVAMHRSGFLGRFIPEFGRCFCQAQHNRVHLYTVDVHSLYVVRELESLGTEEAAAEVPLFAAAWSQRDRRGPLLLAGLLHDIAKSHGAAHSRVGADLAVTILGRLGYDEDAIRRVEWLVRYHLLLSDTALHRDLYDPKTLAQLKAIIPDREHLDDLLALTWADSRATNPDLFTSWRQSLVEDCYRAAMLVVDPEGMPSELELPPVDEVRARVEALLVPEVGRKKAFDLADLVVGVDAPPQAPGLERSSAETLATHAVLLDQRAAAEATGEGSAFAIHVRHLTDQGVSQWMVCTRDQVGTFSLLAGTLTACGFSIVNAEARTRADGACVDTFWVTDLKGRTVQDPGRWRRAERLLRRVLTGEEDLDGAVQRALRQVPPLPDPGSLTLQGVEVSNEISELATVIEVVTKDRPGLVFGITRILREHGLDLRVAKIATRHDLASDSFYVVNRRGKQLGKRLRRQIQSILRERFC